MIAIAPTGVYMPGYGMWSGWIYDGQEAGTTGLTEKIDGLRGRLQP